MIQTILSFSIFLSILTPSLSNNTFNVQDYGAMSGGTKDSSKAFLDAWNDACGSGSPSTVLAPAGEFLIGEPITFNGKECRSRITVQIDGSIVAPSDYTVIARSENWIVFREANSVTLQGGLVNARGQGLWKCREHANCPKGANSVAFYHSNDVHINGLTSINSQNFHINIYNSKNVGIKGINITNPASSPNTDGIHVQCSSFVTISGSDIGTGDDCISMGPGTENVWIDHINCGPGHGISIGSLGKDAQEEGVHNVTVQTVTFQGTQNGVRIKTWPRQSNGYVRDVTFEDVTIIDAENPIIIDQHYSALEDDPNQAGIEISGVTYRGIHGTSAFSDAISLKCNANTPCSNIILQDINLSYHGSQSAQASCSNVHGSTIGIVVPSGCF